MVRGRVTATLLESVHDLKLAYEARYRDFQEFALEDKLTHLVDVGTELELSPTTRARVSNHFVHGAFESQEFDPGGEVAGSTDPFYRNQAGAIVAFDFSERLGADCTACHQLSESFASFPSCCSRAACRTPPPPHRLPRRRRCAPTSPCRSLGPRTSPAAPWSSCREERSR